MAEEGHLPPGNDGRTEATPPMERQAPTEVLPVNVMNIVSVLISVYPLEQNISVSDWYRVVSVYCFRITFFCTFYNL